jgi:uncharacterized protein YjbI with pentapeptide repeats
MANPKHEAKLMKGAAAWNEWRHGTDETPDLSGAKLKNLSLDGYNLQATNFSSARLVNVTFQVADCDECSFEASHVIGAEFHEARLRKANFQDSLVGLTVFRRCVLDESDFSNARLFNNIFASMSLEYVRGLEGTDARDNSIGIDTFFQSAGLPESFLRSSGVPEEFIQYAASLVGKAIEYYSCFLSYSSKDDEFARRLYNDLQGRNIRTWFAPEDLKIGDRFRSRIDESIRSHDKLVLVLSANSVNSDWVETEVESALEREQKEGKDVLFPIAIDEEGFTSKQPWAADIRRKRHIGDFRKWKSHDDYTAAFDKLVRDLKKSQPPIIMKG